ncbi:hypothetical protein [Vibrio splendidus]|uniref:hypothetical protein n=1 Tax=Vibrio splendidus TaxID=29497 RepID=UPI000066FCA5|nr:hypothetical protein [Vibrio splendidus]EAP95690.1 putative lipoprotein [Vibrio splendidus 12B01]OCH63249.1 hypothetical protein A6D94_15670 [Vibrio splendidus]
MKLLKNVLLFTVFQSLLACSQLHHVQISDIDQSHGALTPISIQINELGFDAAETMQFASYVAKNEKGADNLQSVALILALMNMGPTTGTPVYNNTYANQILHQVNAQCPSRNLTGLTSIRESINAGTVSNEFVRVDGFCIN